MAVCWCSTQNAAKDVILVSDSVRVALKYHGTTSVNTTVAVSCIVVGLAGASL